MRANADVVETCDGETEAHTDDLVRQIRQSCVYEVARRTRLDRAPRLSARLGHEVLLKREDQQVTFSFKVRGAANRIARLSHAERHAGIVAASAGNHAQGVALSARRLNLRATIVMPRTTPAIKVESVRALGAEIVLEGDHFAKANTYAIDLAQRYRRSYVHPFDDPLVVAGQGTVAEDLLQQQPGPLAAVFVPVGGGGLVAGIGAYVKAVSPQTAVIGVEPVDADAMARSLRVGRRVCLERVGRFADGVAVHEVGDYPFRVAQRVVDQVVRVTRNEVCAAMREIFDDTRAIVEPSGALAVAGLIRYVREQHATGARLVAVLSGANVDFDRLPFVVRRSRRLS
jgi:threonine dehydratase